MASDQLKAVMKKLTDIKTAIMSDKFEAALILVKGVTEKERAGLGNYTMELSPASQTALGRREMQLGEIIEDLEESLTALLALKTARTKGELKARDEVKADVKALATAMSGQ